MWQYPVDRLKNASADFLPGRISSELLSRVSVLKFNVYSLIVDIIGLSPLNQNRAQYINNLNQQAMHVDRDIFNNALDAIIILDASGVIKDINPSACQLLKKRRENAISCRLEDFFEGNLSKKRGEVSLKGKENILEYTKALGTDKGVLLYFFRDITEIKQELMRREHFLGIAGHELKNPLAAIKALNHLLLYQKKVREDKFLREHIQKVNLKTDTLTRLIMELLDITKIKHRQLDLQIEDVNINDLVKDVVDDFHRTNSTHRVEVQYLTDINLKIDTSRIEQVLINLLKNAAKYSPDSDIIFVNIKRSKKYIICEVIDYGVGIPADQLGKVFNLYYRLPGRENTFSGLGVGLYIANQIVKAHGGRMKVKSAPGRGSQFIFYLPLVSQLKESSRSYYDEQENDKEN